MEQISDCLCRYQNYNFLASIHRLPSEFLINKQQCLTCVRSVRNLCSIPLFCSFILSRLIQWLDIISHTFASKGTMWAQQIITSMYEYVNEYSTNSQKMPWLGAYTHQLSPRLFTSHLSQVLMPLGLKDKKGMVRAV